MRIHDFGGADFEPASRFLGTRNHAEHGERSYWQGADELCGLLSRSDHGFVATDDADGIVGLALLASPREEDHNRDLRMHWTQQRTVIRAVGRTLGMSVVASDANKTDDAGGALRAALGDAAADAVVLFCANAEAAPELTRSCAAWLEAHGVAVGEGVVVEDAPRILPSTDADNGIVEGIIDAHAAAQGVPFVPYYYHIRGKDGIEAGIVAWAFGSDVHIDSLAVAESARRKGLGGLLLRHVEEQAKRDGCTTASVDTFSFQAPDYYPAHGYEVVFRYPLDDGTERIYFSKRL